METATVKICGLQSVSTLESMLYLAVDHIGFVFAKSRRQVTPEQAGEMIEYLKANARPIPLTVGVFVNPAKEELTEVLKLAPLDVVQLHGEESPDFCQWVKETFKVKVFKVFSVSERHQHTVEMLLDPYQKVMDAVMLDTYDPIVGGGTGQTFAWDCIPDYKQWTKQQGLPLMIAGGLHADNVSDLIAEYHPDGIDVSSGVESDGVKDITKIKNFVERVKR
jgi:phosphoribosylanthranilate isomerase